MVPLVVFFALATIGIDPDPIEAGAATVQITPPTGYPLWGYAVRKDKASVGVLDPLEARALVLKVGKDQMALVSLDLGRPPTRTSTSRIETACRKAGIDQIFLVASHTHSGPVLELNDWPSVENSYVKSLEKQLIDLILQAQNNARPCRLGTVKKKTDLNRNRHSRAPVKPVEEDLLILRVESLDGQPIAHAVNFAAHPTLLPSGEFRFSADFPGVLSRTVAKQTGVPCLFLQGAAGDLSPNTRYGNDPKTFGNALAREVLDLIPTIHCESRANPSLAFRRETFQFSSRINHGSPLVQGLFGTVFFPALVAFYEREYQEGIRPRLDVALLNQQIGFVGCSGEFFCGHSIHLKRRARLETLFFLGTCNDYQQYFPTVEATAEGGYGTEVAVSPVETGAGERMMDRALIHLFKLQGKLILLP